MADRVQVTVEAGVAEVVLDRPDKLNALDQPMFAGLVAAADRLASEPGVRAVVLAGAGRGFCAGLDMAAFASMAGGDGPGAAATGLGRTLAERLPGRITNLAQQAAHGWAELPVPVIAALHGHVLGGGLQIALGADIRIAAPDAKLSVMEIRWGILPDMTGIPALVRLAGIDVVKELVYTGRTVSGEEAHRLGLVTRVAADPRAEALALARDIASKNPHAIRGMKALCDAAPGRPLADAFADESARMDALIGSPNQVEAVMAQLEGRPPDFADV